MHFPSPFLFRAFQATLLFLALSFQGVAQAPSFAWAMSNGGPGDVGGFGNAIDGSGNSYVTGSFSGTATLGSTTLSSNGGYDIFIAKFDASGNALWAKKAGGTTNDFAYRIAIDGSGNSYITGTFTATATFGSTTLSSSGGYDMFIAKYDASGNLLWAKKAGGGTGNDSGNHIAIDGSGNSIATGFFDGTASFGSITLSSSGNYDVFIAKYDASGNVLWAQKAGGTYFDSGSGIAVDGSGNSYVTGWFVGPATFGSTTLSSSGNYDVFIAKYDPSGNVLWAQKAGGTDYDYSFAIGIDGSGNSYITGSFKGSATFGSTTLTSNGNEDVFIAKFDASGNVLWAQKAGGSLADEGNSIAVDGIGNSYVTGVFQDSVPFGSTTLSSSGNRDVFIAKYDGSGNALWAQKAGGIENESSNAIALDGSGNSYVTGSFLGTATFGSTTITGNGNGIQNLFICKLGSAPLGLPSEISAALLTYPNPFSTSFQLSLSANGPASIVLTDVLGREVHRQVATGQLVTIVPAENLPSGMYILQVQQGETILQQRVIKQ